MNVVPDPSESPLLTALAHALRERLLAIADHAHRDRDPAGHLERLRATAREIERLHAALPLPRHPDLEHYLQRASFDKALAWIEDRFRA